MIFIADLPMPPSANTMFATDFKTKRRFLSKEYAAWKKEAGRALIEQWQAAEGPVIGKPYAVHIELNLNHQADIANREKAITDLLVATIPGFPGDQWVNRMLIERNRDIEAARVEVVTLGGEG
jgi:hypothetical protein